MIDHDNRSFDDWVDTALARLNDVQPDEGMQRRIRTRLAALPESRTKAFGRPSFARIAFACSLGALAVAAFFTASHHNAFPRISPSHTSAVPPTSAPIQAVSALPSRPGAFGRLQIPPAQNTRMGTTSRPLRSGAERTLSRGHGDTNLSSAMIADELDHPAPELPLTDQERLLLRLAHGNAPMQVAVNKRFIMPRQSAELSSDFDKFFEPYTLPLTEGEPQ